MSQTEDGRGLYFGIFRLECTHINKTWREITWINKTWSNKTWINKTWSDITRIYDQVRKLFFPRFHRI